MDENVIAHAFHHNAFLIVSNGHRARYGSITSTWEHFAEWKRLDETEREFPPARRLEYRTIGIPEFKALIMERAAFAFAGRHDNIEAIRAAAPGDDQMDAKPYDLSGVDLYTCSSGTHPARVEQGSAST